MRSLSILLLLCGCSSYWVKDSEPVQVTYIDYVDSVYCRGEHAGDWGCANRDTGIIQIWNGLRGDELKCVYRHEMAHLQGWNHDDRLTYRINCGPED